MDAQGAATTLSHALAGRRQEAQGERALYDLRESGT